MLALKKAHGLHLPQKMVGLLLVLPIKTVMLLMEVAIFGIMFIRAIMENIMLEIISRVRKI
jgi:hypothetical protein